MPLVLLLALRHSNGVLNRRRLVSPEQAAALLSRDDFLPVLHQCLEVRPRPCRQLLSHQRAGYLVLCCCRAVPASYRN